MKRPIVQILFVCALIIFVIATAIYVPNSLPVGSDFSALYYADLALVNGIHVYDIPAMEALALSKSNIPAQNFFMPRFPYPPWYMLSTFYLGLLPIQTAGALWFQLNIIMLFLSIWLLTDGWNGRLRLIAFPLGLFFLPVLGALSVGQYDFPVLLGTSLLIYSLKKENIPLTTLGMMFVTFKPHIGVLVLLSALGWLFVSRNSYGQRAMRSVILAGIALAILSFIADPLWFINYPKMLLNYQGEGNVITCSECASIPVWVSRWLFGAALRQAAVISFVLLATLAILFWMIGKSLLKSPKTLITSVLLATLLISPYLYNYDFVLLLIPFAVFLEKSNFVDRLVVAVSYLVPSLAILLFGRAGNITLNIVTILLTFTLYLRLKRTGIDVPASASYNENN